MLPTMRRSRSQGLLRSGTRWFAALWLLAFPGIDAGAAAVADTPSATVLVAYDTLGGQSARMAEAVVEGARKVRGVTVVLRKVAEVTREDLVEAQGIVLGCPTYYGSVPGRMKAVIDDWSWKWKVEFTDKAGGAFATGGGRTGGKEFVVLSLLMFMLNNRMVVAGPLYRNDTTGSVWAEAGATAVTGPADPGVDDSEMDGARRLGERVAGLALKLQAGSRPPG